MAVVLELARALRERPVRGRARAAGLHGLGGVVHGGHARVRAAATSPRSRPSGTEVVCLDSVGSPELILIEGEGMLRMRDYTPELRDRIAAVAGRAGVHLRRRLRLGLATDGLIALKAGYPSAAIGSVTKYKLPLNYHSPARHGRRAGLRDGARRGGAVRGARAGVSRLAAPSRSRARATASSRVAISPA